MELLGGYAEKYDPFPALERLEKGDANALDELWKNLYHQGDVNTASYAAVPSLVKLGQLSLVGAIEVSRIRGGPKVPAQIQEKYNKALKQSLKCEPTTEEDCQGYYIIHASLAGQTNLAVALHLFSPAEVLAEYA